MKQHHLPLSCILAVALIVLGCQEEFAPIDQQLANADRVDTSAFGAMFRGIPTTVFEDTGGWQDWQVERPGQVWSQAELGIKWIAFDPNSNIATTPEFDPVREVRITFEMYFPKRFPVYVTSENEPGRLFGITSDVNEQDLSADHNQICIDLFQGQTWRIHAMGYDADIQLPWDSRDAYLTPWAFEHGWNEIEWIISLGDDVTDDMMRLKVGDRIYAWTEVDIAASGVPFRHFYFGNWDVKRGQRSFAFRDLKIVNLTEGEATPPPPPDGGDEGGDNPPPPPGGGGGSSPPPDPGTDIASGGHVIDDGFWSGWRARTHGGNCEGSPCIRFHDQGDHGSFQAASQAIRHIGGDDDGHGSVRFDILFEDGQLGTGAGGKHLFNITSRPLGFTPRDVGLGDWTRVDFNQPGEGRIRATIFNLVDDEPLNDGFWPSHTFDVPFAVGQWASVDIEWRQVNDDLTVTIGNDSHTFRLMEGSENLGNYIAFGNIYNIDGEIQVANVSWQQ